MPPTSYSGTLMRWAGPLLTLVADAPQPVRKNALDIAATAWNAVVLEDCGSAPGAVADLLNRINTMPEPGRTLFTRAVTELIRSKRTTFAAEQWAISRCELRDGERVFVEARALPRAT